MRLIRTFLKRLTGLFPSARRERELNDELEAHLQLHIDDNIRAGMTPHQARREAVMRLGGVEPTKQEYRERRTIPFLENTIGDFRFALRQLKKNPGFTATAVFILALGMCASIAIFAFVDAALLKPLPYNSPNRLVGVFERIEGCPFCNLSYLDYLDWKKLNKSFQSLDVYVHNGMMLNTPDGVKAAKGARVSDGFFRTLGVTPVLGRDFYPGEDLPQAPHTVLLSYSAWQERYGGKADVLGKTVTLNDDPTVIIGVLPREFHFAPAEPAEFWTQLNTSGTCEKRRSCHNLYGVARLKEGVSIETAFADVKLIAQQLEAQNPATNRGQGGAVQSLKEEIAGDIRPIFLLLMAGTGLLLLIASVNVASLLLLRSENRRKEISVRSALGASSGRLASQFVTEGLVLVAAGCAVGFTAASWAMQLLLKLISPDMLAGMPYLRQLGFNLHVAAFAATLALLAAVLFSITPTLHFSLSKMREGIAEGSRGSSGRGWSRIGSKLVIVELATAMILLVGAGLLGKSLYRLLHVDIGIRTDHLVTMQIDPPRSYRTTEKAIALERLVVSRIGDLPGVKSVAVASDIPISHWGNTTWIRILGRPWHGEHIDLPERDVSANYFATLGAKLHSGRFFDEADDRSRPKVAIINQAFARQHFPGEDPIGKQVSSASPKPDPVQIVGLIEDVKEGSLDSTARPTLYVPYNQSPDSDFNIVVRTEQAEQSLIPALADTIRQVDPDIVATRGQTMTARINDSYSAYLHRSSAYLVGGFAVLALLLGVVGLYGVVAYSVSQRTREIGVRMALGAQRASVYRLIFKEAGSLMAIGIVIGIAGSIAAAKLMVTLLFGVSAWDIEILAGVAGLLGVASLSASFLPARRAASVNPVEALRAE